MRKSNSLMLPSLKLPDLAGTRAMLDMHQKIKIIE